MTTQCLQDSSLSHTVSSRHDHFSIIGNSTLNVIIDLKGRCVWACAGHFGADPIFNCLLNNDSNDVGFFDILLTDCCRVQQNFIGNTGILSTTLISNTDDIIEIRDFTPRFQLYSRMHRPFQLFRMIRRIQGDPQIVIQIRPTFNYNSSKGFCTRGSHHIRYCGPRDVWRVTTDVPISNILEEIPILVNHSFSIVLGADTSLETPIQDVSIDFIRKTEKYWSRWIESIRLPYEYQEHLIRTAITLQMMSFEEQGGLTSSFTFGIPLGPNAPATKDERIFRFLDECLTISSLKVACMFDLYRSFLELMKNLCFRSNQLVFGIMTEEDIDCEKAIYLAGYKGMGPVYHGGVVKLPKAQLCLHDRALMGLFVYALCQSFFDERLDTVCSEKLFNTLEKIATSACNAFDSMNAFYEDRAILDAEKKIALQPSLNSLYFDDDPRSTSMINEENKMAFLMRGDAAISSTEYVAGSNSEVLIHTFTTAVAWASAVCIAKIAFIKHQNEKSNFWRKRANMMKSIILHNAFNPDRNTVTTYWGGRQTGPSVLRLTELDFIEGSSSVFIGSVNAFEHDAAITASSNYHSISILTRHSATEPEAIQYLKENSTVFSTVTLLCYVEALKTSGRVSDARILFEAILHCMSKIGTLPQAIDLASGKFWGNLPYCTCLLRLFRCGLRLSRSMQSLGY